MKRSYRALLSILVFLFAGDFTLSYAQLSSQGEWRTTEITTDTEIILTGDIQLTGGITISSGKTLSIINNSDRDITIGNKTGTINLFIVNGTLKIRGNEKGRVILDGGADYTLDTDAMTLTPGTTKTRAGGIRNTKFLYLDYVTIQNINSSDANGGAIDISSNNAETRISNCTIQKCRAELGSAMMIQGNSPVYIENSEIIGCFSGGGSTNNSGGAIRTYGNVQASLYLKGVTFRYNYARRNTNYNNTLAKDGNGGALFWNARGLEDTKCVIDGCLFEYNKCDDNGGAIKSQATVIFEGKTTIIRENTAPNGAALYIEGYTGSSGVTSKRDIIYDLNDKLEITDNHSPSYIYNGTEIPGKGAGIHFYFGPNMTLEKGSSISVDMTGTTISDNTVNGAGSCGGGIYFENTSLEGKYTFDINLSHGKVINNVSEGYGGGIYVYKGEVQSELTDGKSFVVSGNTSSAGAGLYIQDGSLSMVNGTITGNTITGSGNGGGIYIEDGDFTIDAGEVSGNTVASGRGAGVYIVGSNGKGNFTMNGGEIKGNTTSGDNGGGVYINGGNFILNDGAITDNKAADGGGVYLNNGNFSLVTGKISGNTASGYGGGVYLIGEDCVYILKNGAIGENSAKDGGGVYLANGSFILAENTSDVGSISGNTASGNGGGVFIAGSGDFTMNGGTVEKNYTSGSNGGGIFLNGGNFKMTDGRISGNGKDTGGNTSTENGGGVYLNGGSIEVEKGSISSNASTANGGGVYIMNGEVRMGSGYINGNSCGQYGGGVYVFNSSVDKTTVSFNGGTLTENTAKYGGGVCVDGLIDMTIGNVEIAENSATNGGGVCLMNSAHMNFGTGEIKNNKALTSTAFTTGYKKDIGTVEGFGGGVFLDSDTSLEFGTGTDLGLFGNIADNGGDEIFANGMNTTVDLPDVTNMALGGYDGASNLKWIEDYPTDDPHYDSGTKLKGSAWDSNKTNLRYRDAVAQNATIYNLSGAAEHDTRYICFALGYEVIYITVTKYGLEKGESSIFHLSKSGAHDFRIVITGDGSEKVSKRVAVTAGEWSIRETPWSWTYDLTGSDGNALPERVITKDIADEENRLFVFKGNRTGTLPMNSEDIEVNTMGY